MEVDAGSRSVDRLVRRFFMGHAAYARGSAAISAHIDQQAKARRKSDALSLAEARADREKARADKAESKIAELEATLAAARRSVVSLRGSLQCEREERAAEVEGWKFKARFAAKAMARIRGNSANAEITNREATQPENGDVDSK